MGTQWGVNRSVAQIHALLFVSERPMHAEEIAQTLDIARSNVSSSIRELITWRLISRAPVPGDRRDHFEAVTDVITMVKTIAQGRKEREIDPASRTLAAIITKAEDDPAVGKVALTRLREFSRFMDQADALYDQILSLPPGRVNALLKMGRRILQFLPQAK